MQSGVEPYKMEVFGRPRYVVAGNTVEFQIPLPTSLYKRERRAVGVRFFFLVLHPLELRYKYCMWVLACMWQCVIPLYHHSTTHIFSFSPSAFPGQLLRLVMDDPPPEGLEGFFGKGEGAGFCYVHVFLFSFFRLLIVPRVAVAIEPKPRRQRPVWSPAPRGGSPRSYGVSRLSRCQPRESRSSCGMLCHSVICASQRRGVGASAGYSGQERRTEAAVVNRIPLAHDARGPTCTR